MSSAYLTVHLVCCLFCLLHLCPGDGDGDIRGVVLLVIGLPIGDSSPERDPLFTWQLDRPLQFFSKTGDEDESLPLLRVDLSSDDRIDIPSKLPFALAPVTIDAFARADDDDGDTRKDESELIDTLVTLPFKLIV